MVIFMSNKTNPAMNIERRHLTCKFLYFMDIKMLSDIVFRLQYCLLRKNCVLKISKLTKSATLTIF